MTTTRARLASLLTAALVSVLAPTAVHASVALPDTPAYPSGERDCPDADGLVLTCDVPYIDDGDLAHTLDIYQPAGVTDAPVVLMIHGGGWASGTSTGVAKEAVYFARHGLAAVSINYTLSTRDQPSWPTVLDDVEASAAWVRANGESYELDGTRIGTLGVSAGGHLAALLATAGATPVIATVSLSGPMDLLADTSFVPAQAALAQLLGCLPSDCPVTAAQASPIASVDPTDESMLLFNSQYEKLVPLEQAQAMDAVLTAASVPHELVVVPGGGHGRAYECVSFVIDGVKQTVMDASFTYLASRLMTGPVPAIGGYCKD